MRAHQGRQSFWNSVQSGGPGVRGALFLGAFDLLPLREDGFGGFELVGPYYMRVPVNELVHNPACDSLEIKRATFLGELGVENDLEEEIAEFLFHLVIIARFNGVEQFVDLL